MPYYSKLQLKLIANIAKEGKIQNLFNILINLMILHLTEAKYLEGYKVEVTFNNGRHGVVDLSDALNGPVFEPLKNLSLFSKLKVDEELETIVWPNGADLAPEFLYFKAFKNHIEFQEQFRKWGYLA